MWKKDSLFTGTPGTSEATAILRVNFEEEEEYRRAIDRISDYFFHFASEIGVKTKEEKIYKIERFYKTNIDNDMKEILIQLTYRAKKNFTEDTPFGEAFDQIRGDVDAILQNIEFLLK